MSQATSSWASSATALARAVERRARVGHLVSGLGLGLLGGALAALALRAAGTEGVALLALGSGAVAGAAYGFLRARRVAAVHAGDAAWALDRLAGAHEQGLTAALFAGHARHAGVRAGAEPLPAPPHVRLQPPRGLALLGGGAVLAALALVVPEDQGSTAGAAAGTDAGERVAGTVSGPLGGAAGDPSATAEVEALGVEAERVRKALGLSAAESRDPAAVVERLSDPQALAAAREAAGQSGALEQALAGGPASAADVAARLGAGTLASDALEAARRADLSRAGAWLAPHLPAARRATVERYFALRAREGRPR